MPNSYVVWFLDGKYSLAWGNNPEEARVNYLSNWGKSIKEVVPADGYRNPLPNHLYVNCPVMQVDEPSIHAPLNQPSAPAPTMHGDLEDLKAQVAALVELVKAKKEEPAE